MITRPWPLVILAIIQILTPFGNVLFNAWALDLPASQVLQWILQKSPLQIFESLALMPLTGLALLRMRKWSYAVFVVAMLWSAFRNISRWHFATSQFPLAAVLIVYGLEFALATYFLLPAVRNTYFDPSVRWWEAKPRYVLQLEALLTAAAQKLQVKILNLSEGGVFLSCTTKLPIGDSISLEFSILGQPYLVEGKIVHARSLEDGASCYGIQITHSPDSRRRFQSLAKALRELGFQERIDRPTGWRGLVAWARRLVSTGKGLVPEVRYRK